MWWSMASLTMAALMLGARADKFVIGYLTGSQRRKGDLLYDRPGLTISGAISLAVEEVNALLLGPMGHSIEFEVAETYGDEETSIRQTALLWSRNVSAYIGPQETCVHEGRMAAAFNLPMISYYCMDHETSDKRHYPTFARTRPPETQISKSVAALLLHFNWTHVAFLYLNAPDSDFSKVAFSILETIREVGIVVPFVRSWSDSYHYGYTKNPFLKIIQDTFVDTRIYVTVGNYYDHVGFMLAMDEMKLLEKGDYFVIGVDTEQYSEAEPARYLRGLLSSSSAPRSPIAFRSYLAVVPSPTRAFKRFATSVNRYMEMPPFNFPNPLKYLGGQLEIRPEAAFLYDAVWLYARALVATLHAGGDPRDGVAIAQHTRDTHTNSAMGYMVYMDANGDAEGNYTLLGLENIPVPGLYPVGGFWRHKTNGTGDLP